MSTNFENQVAESSANDSNITTFVNNASRNPHFVPKRQACHANLEALLRDETIAYINGYSKHTTGPLTVRLFQLADIKTEEAHRIHDELLDAFDEEITLENACRRNNHKKPFSIPNKLPAWIASMIVLATSDTRVLYTGTSGTLLVTKKYYKNARTNGQWKWAGTWDIVDESSNNNLLMKAFRLLCPSAEPKDAKAFMSRIYDSEDCRATQNDDLVFCRNGVWNYETRTFTEYDDPNYDTIYPTEISLGKLPVWHPLGKAPKGKVAELDANGNVIEPVLSDRGDHTPWHPDSIFTEPFDMNTEVGKASSLICWQMGQSLIRKRNLGDGYYMFKVDYMGNGQNGKGTMGDAQRRLVQKDWEEGDEDLGDMSNRVIALAVDELDDGFKLSSDIMTANAIWGEESDASFTYIEHCRIIKDLSRRNEMTFREIFGKPFKYRFDGLLVQESQHLPIWAEKDDSVISHSCCIPFAKSFADCNKKYIKKDYVLRDIVASYFLYKLTVDMPKLDDYDQDAIKTLEPFKRNMLANGMNTFQFCDEALAGLNLSVIPTELLYDLYIRWCELRGVSGKSVVTEKSFRDDMQQYSNHNDHQVKWIEHARKTVDLDEVDNNEQPAMAEFGHTAHLGESDWMYSWRKDYKEEEMHKAENRKWYLNRNKFCNADHKTARQFSRGFFQRIVPYDKMHYDTREEQNIVADLGVDL